MLLLFSILFYDNPHEFMTFRHITLTYHSGIHLPFHVRQSYILSMLLINSLALRCKRRFVILSVQVSEYFIIALSYFFQWNFNEHPAGGIFSRLTVYDIIQVQ